MLGRTHEGRHLLLADLRLAASARGHFGQSLWSTFLETLLPETDRGLTDLQIPTNDFTAFAPMGFENNHASQNNTLRSAGRSDPTLQLLDFSLTGMDF